MSNNTITTNIQTKKQYNKIKYIRSCAQSSYVLRYSPVSAWLKITTPVGSSYFVCKVPLAATPNPSGKSLRL